MLHFNISKLNQYDRSFKAFQTTSHHVTKASVTSFLIFVNLIGLVRKTRIGMIMWILSPNLDQTAMTLSQSDTYEKYKGIRKTTGSYSHALSFPSL